MPPTGSSYVVPNPNGGPNIVFSVGDRVKLPLGRWGDNNCNPAWGGQFGYVAGTVRNIDMRMNHYDLNLDVVWDNGYSNYYDYFDLEKIESATNNSYLPYKQII